MYPLNVEAIKLFAQERTSNYLQLARQKRLLEQAGVKRFSGLSRLADRRSAVLDRLQAAFMRRLVRWTAPRVVRGSVADLARKPRRASRSRRPSSP